MVSSCARLKKHMFLHKIKRFYSHCMFLNAKSCCYMNPCDFPMVAWVGVGNNRHGQSAGCRNWCQVQVIRWCGQGFWLQKTQPYAYDNLEICGNPMISWLAFGAPKQIHLFGPAPCHKICVKTWVLLLGRKKPCYVHVNAIFSSKKYECRFAYIKIPSMLQWWCGFCIRNSLLFHELIRFWHDCIILVRAKSSWTMGRAQGSELRVDCSWFNGHGSKVFGQRSISKSQEAGVRLHGLRLFSPGHGFRVGVAKT